MLFYTAILSFLNVSNLYYVQTYGFSLVEAAKISSIAHLIPLFFGPPTGYLVDFF